MNKLKNWLWPKLFWVKTGYQAEVLNDGKPVDELVIKYKQYYFSIMLDAESKEPTGDFGWSEDPMIFNVPVRDIIETKL